MGSIPGSERYPGGGHDNPFQDSCLENPMDRGVWRVTLSPWGHKESDMTEQLNTITHAWSIKDQYFGHLMQRADAKSWLIRKNPDAGKDWRQEEKGTTEDEMVGWHHWLNGYEFEQALGDGEGHRSLAICNPWGHKESHTSVQLTCPSWREMSFNYPKVTPSMHFKLYLKAH